MKKLLLVSPFTDDRDLYPHLRNFMDEISKDYDIDYFHVKERGYWIESILGNLKRNPFKKGSYSAIYNIFKNSVQLFLKRWQHYDAVIAIDNFPYALASFFTGKTVTLWSHDFVDSSQAKSKKFIHRLIALATKSSLKKNNRLIIQDADRLALFLDANNCDESPKHIFYLPVSLTAASPNTQNVLCSMRSTLPILMQIGGINISRSNSDQLLEHFQKNSHKFKLFFHGFISGEIQAILREQDILPLISSVSVSPSQISQIVDACDIGFVSYVANDLNFHFIARASGQLVEFLRCGKPIIVMGNTNLQKYVEDNAIGISIESIEELVPAIEKIEREYSFYSRNSLAKFNEIYNIQLYIPELNRYLQNHFEVRSSIFVASSSKVCVGEIADV
jgi:glycosyltransferase involved in cell wall biosynthesis